MLHPDLLRLSGLLEGEGSFGCYTSPGNSPGDSRLTITMTSTDEDVVKWVASIFEQRYSNRKPTGFGKKTVFTTVLRGHRAASLMMKLYPLMFSRRKAQILAALIKWQSRLIITTVA